MGLHENLMDRLFTVVNPGTASSLFKHAWKIRLTPGGFPVLALRASSLKSAQAPWPTPDASAGNLTDSTWEARRAAAAAAHGNNGFGLTVAQAASLAAWPTPNARDFKCGPTETYAERSGTTKGDSLSNLVTAVCAGWPTTTTQDSVGSRAYGYGGQTFFTLTDAALSAAPGPALTGSSVVTKNSGQLAPSHSRWLMGLPKAWDECAVRSLPKSRKK